MALEASLPLISCNTTDTVNIRQILSYIKDESVKEFDETLFSHIGSDRTTRFLKSSKEATTFYVIDPDDDIEWDKVYAWLVKNSKTLVVVNADYSCHSFFNAGTAKLPAGMLKEFLSEFVGEDEIEELASVCGGLTLKDIGEIVSLACSHYGEITPSAITSMRGTYLGNNPGIQQVDTELEFYYPNEQIEEWLEVEGKLFLEDIPKRLIPRGLLLKGAPGVGKTLAAKRIANALTLPLYRVDLGSMMSKWFGESEQALNQVLTTIDNSEPCVILLDEIEKLFQAGEEHGVTTRMLSQLLWWLQERESKVFVIMTTNNRDTIPSELIRPGRIDQEIEFKGLTEDQAVDFTERLMASFEGQLPRNIDFGYYKPGLYPHAQVAQTCFSNIKIALAKTL